MTPAHPRAAAVAVLLCATAAAATAQHTTEDPVWNTGLELEFARYSEGALMDGQGLLGGAFGRCAHRFTDALSAAAFASNVQEPVIRAAREAIKKKARRAAKPG